MNASSPESESKHAIKFHSATKKYGQLLAVDDLNLTIEKGELFGFLGPNGAGKTTTMKLAAGLVKPSSGSVSICGWDIQDEPLEAKKLIGFVPDSPYIYESLSGREFLHFCAGLYKISHNAVTQKIPELQEQFGIGNWIDKKAGEYSHGMKQRVVMASAFIHEPRVILIDEPMVGLDPAGVRLIKDVLREFCSKGGGVFLSTHTLSDAEELCHRLGIIKNGEIIAYGTVDDVRTDGKRLEEAFLDLTSGETNS